MELIGYFFCKFERYLIVNNYSRLSFRLTQKSDLVEFYVHFWSLFSKHGVGSSYHADKLSKVVKQLLLLQIQ